jgi:DNA-binding protein
MFMLTNLPMAFIAGLRITFADIEKVTVSVPYKFLNKNPFKSIYFAVLSMAAELPSGILAMNAVKNSHKPVSMLVLNMTVEFKKKAKSKIHFTCEDGKLIANAVKSSIESNSAETVKIKSIGKDTNGLEVAEFTFTWTFKPYS